MSLFSIGYGGRSLNELVVELHARGITLLIDIRSKPVSRMFVFNRPVLESRLPRVIKYKWYGETLGGLTDIAPIVKQVQLKQLLKLAGKENICLMCAERDPDRCHRKRDLGPIIESLGGKIEHII